MVKTRKELNEKQSDRGNFLAWLMHLGVLANKRTCRKCRSPMKLTPSKGSDGFRWKCNLVKCKKNTCSVRKGSVFANIKASLNTIFSVAYEWCNNTSLKTISRELKIGYKCINTIVALLRKLIRRKTPEKIGGVGQIVEIDETAVTKRKYGKGRVNAQLWCIGGICRETNAVFFEISKKRTRVILQDIIQRNVLSGSKVYTDEWPGYSGLNTLGYDHKTVCHKTNFLNPVDKAINTQKIEATWRWLKEYRKLYGSNYRKNLASYIDEFKFKRGEKHIFAKLLPRLKTSFMFK